MKTDIAGVCMEFFYDYEGLTIKMEYGKKDYSATYESPYGTIKYGSHIMAKCPWVFTEKQIRNEKARLAGEYFVAMKKFLDENSDFIEKSKQELKERYAPVEKEIELQRQKKIEMKKKFKAGEISEEEYSAACKLSKRIKDSLYTVDRRFYDELQQKCKLSLTGIQHLIFE